MGSDETDDDGPDRGVPPVVPPGTASVIRREARRMAWIYTAAVVVLLPWVVYLAVSLPKRNLTRHYRMSWVGFDLLLAFAFARTAYLAFRVDPRVQLPATATATLLLVDAWFDVTTAGTHAAFFEALFMALVFELPAAAFSLYLVHRVNVQVGRLEHLDRLLEAGRDPPETRRH